MITWFQRVFGKHFKWVLVAFLGVLFVSFIVSIGAMPQLNMQGRQNKTDIFLGIDRGDQQTMGGLASAINYTFNKLYLQQVSSDKDMLRLIDYRIVEMHLADEWHIPEPNTQQLENFLKSARAFRGTDGHFSPEIYQKFKDEVDAKPAAERDAETALLKEECRLDRVRDILGGPGYVLPFVAEAQSALSKIKTDLDVATLDYKAFTPTIELTGDKLNAMLQGIYDKEKDRFPRPALVNLSFVKFPASAAGDPTAVQLTDFAKLHKDAFPDLNPDLLTDKDKTKLTTAWRKDQTTILMNKFGHELYDLTTKGGATFKLDTPQISALLKKYSQTLQKLPVVTVGQPVAADSPIPNDIAQDAAQSLNEHSPALSAQLPDGAALVFYVDSTPSRPSADFNEARADVLKAYTEIEKQRQFVEHCKTLRETVVKDMAAGKTFVEAAKAEGFAVKNYPAVTVEDILKTGQEMPLSDEDKTTPMPEGPLAAMGRDALTVLVSSENSTIPLFMAVHTGETSPILTQGNTGVLFYVVKREAEAVPASSPELQKLDLDMARQERLITSTYMLDRLAQNFHTDGK